MFLLCSVHTTGWIQWKEMSRYLLFLKEFVFSNHFYLYIPSWVGWFFFLREKPFSILSTLNQKAMMHFYIYFLRRKELNVTQEYFCYGAEIQIWKQL